MSDFSELKQAAETCKEALPLRYMESHGSLYVRNDHGIVFDVHQNRSFPEFMAANKAYADLVLAANPAAVLALIAENERLRAGVGSDMAEIDRIQGEYDKQFRKARELRNERDQLFGQTEQLKAEIEAGRRQIDTLTEWYANALNEIKECSSVLPCSYYMDPPDGGDVRIPEQLRRMAKDAERYRWLRSVGGKVWKSPIPGIPPVDVIYDIAVDAVMGKGEQS